MTEADAMLDRNEARRVAHGDAADLFALLARQPLRDGWALRAWVPGAQDCVAVARDDGRELKALQPGHEEGLFHATFAERPPHYRLRCRRGGDEWEVDDPYQYGPVLGQQDEHYLAEGSHLRLWTKLGAHPTTHEGAEGTVFAVWAPNARRVSVVGDFNDWDGRRHVMRPRGATGVWEIFIPGVGEGVVYKYEIKGADGSVLPLKADPLGLGSEHPPQNASVVRSLPEHDWKDREWMEARKARNRVDAPISIYEMHTTSWRRGPGGKTLTWRELGETLIPYVKEMGYTHIETLPISEYPFDGSWGYQPVGLYAPTSRHGDLHEFREFVEMVHEAGLGLLIDWVPAHFPTDAHGLARFDGTPLYEHADPREGYHMDWNTYIYNFGRREVSNFLVANAIYWLKEHHVDGLRVDAVASMLYRDYSRKSDEWVPNKFGGRENLEAIDFLKRMNEVVYGEDDSVMTVAEESTAWPGVSKPVFAGGLGFGYKWNMGWMHDTLEYISRDPMYRRYHHHQMTFGLIYAFSENFILPISHDEVVHGKGSMLGKMPGDDWQKFANLRAYYSFMWAHPGKKLLFMGQEFGQRREWNEGAELDWGSLQDPKHAGLQALVKDLNHLYRELPALHEKDCEGDGFQWIEGNAAEESVYAFARFGKADAKPALAVFNFTPTPQHGYRIGVPTPGKWVVRLNSDSERYGGSGVGQVDVESRPEPAQGRSDSVELTLPPLGALILEHGG